MEFHNIIIDYNYDCYSSDFFEGQYIYIDTLISPMFGDTIINSFGQTNTCKVGNVPKKVNLQKYFVDSVVDNKREVILKNEYGTNKYLVKYGIGCFSMRQYKNQYINIDDGGFLSMGDEIYLFDSNENCLVSSVERINDYPSIPYTPPTNYTYTPDINTPSPSTLPEINSSLNSVSPTPQTKQTPEVTQERTSEIVSQPEAKPQTQQIESISEPEQKIENSTENPEKPTTASNEFQSLPEKKVTEPTLENPEEPTTISNESQFFPEEETAKPTLTSALLAMVNNIPISSWALGATRICFLIASLILKRQKNKQYKNLLK
ncbi:MAG TPA: hypothetical protein PLL80_00935 [Candidatus Pacearchaeota archaeon]|nr:hypothetical protein [Candidatus Pacearchaeota archaeon]HPO75161.1 hypothetical protein [Candidatus Pacearchaeota archaeon]